MVKLRQVANCNVVTVKKKGVNSFEDILGDHVLSVDILWKRGYFVDAASGVEFFGIDLKKEDCIIVENIGVESVKTLFDSAGDRELETSLKKIPATAVEDWVRTWGARNPIR